MKTISRGKQMIGNIRKLTPEEVDIEEKRKIKMLDDYISGKTMPAFVKQSEGK